MFYDWIKGRLFVMRFVEINGKNVFVFAKQFSF